MKYAGKLGSSFVRGQVKKAYTSLRAQRSRCNNPKDTSYRYYGGKGVRVLYGTRDFIGWWLEQASLCPRGYRLTVDRIDSHGHYSFDNIQLIPFSKNIAEANARTKIRGVVKIDRETGEVLRRYPSMKAAAQEHGVTLGAIWRHCNRLDGEFRYGR